MKNMKDTVLENMNNSQLFDFSILGKDNQPPILDLRNFEQNGINPSSSFSSLVYDDLPCIINSVPITYSSLHYRLHELPNRSKEFCLFSNCLHDLKEGYKFLRKKNWNVSSKMIFYSSSCYDKCCSFSTPSSSLSSTLSPCPHQDTSVSLPLQEENNKNKIFWKCIQKFDCLKLKANHNNEREVKQQLPEVNLPQQKQVEVKGQEIEKNYLFECCDFGCGAGRDLIFLLLRNEKYWNCLGLDQSPSVLFKLFKMTKELKVVQRCQGNSLRWSGNEEFVQEEEEWKLLSNNNSNGHETKEAVEEDNELQRKWEEDHLLALNTHGNFLKPLGFLMVCTFVDVGKPLFSPKNENFILKENELSDLFLGATETSIPSTPGHKSQNKESIDRMGGTKASKRSRIKRETICEWKIIDDKILEIEDGRTVNCFLVQRLK
eukprot:Awhi_evm1s14819